MQRSLVMPVLAAALAAPVPALAQEAPVPPAEPPLAGYDGGFFLRSDDVPPRLELDSLEVGDDRDTGSRFLIRRARLKLSGHAWSEAIGYKFQADFGRGEASLLDYYIDYGVTPLVHVRAGQFKRPFSRQQITSSSALALTARALTDDAFDAGRDIGVMVHNRYEKSPPLEYAVGVFNGTGISPRFVPDLDPDTGAVVGGDFTNVPDTFGPALVARAGINRGGLDGYSEADLEGGPLRWGVAASGLGELDADDDDSSALRGEIDYIVKAHGLSSTGGVYASTAQDGESFGDQSLDALGLHTQVGYVVAGTYQPVLRYALVAPDGGDNDVHEITAGLSVYFFGHKVKWQTDAGVFLRDTPGGTETDVLGRTQLQLAF